MTGAMFVALLALAAVCAVGVLVIADQLAERPAESFDLDEPAGVFDATAEMPVWRGGGHRAPGRWSR